MKLKLDRPIIFFDLETTGLTIGKDHIIELCYIRIEPNGNERAETLRFNPGMPISKEASEVNGITDKDVKNCPSFADKAQELAQVFEGCDLAGYNSNKFDGPRDAGRRMGLPLRRRQDRQRIRSEHDRVIRFFGE